MRGLFIYLSTLACLLPATGRALEPVAQITFAVVDDQGQAVAGAELGMTTFPRWVAGTAWDMGACSTKTGHTDEHGEVVLDLPGETGRFHYFVAPLAGFYASASDEVSFTNTIDNRWEPWNLRIEYVIKKKQRPIPLYARKVTFDTRGKEPVPGERLGFDLLRGDWIPPHGVGVVSDLVFCWECRQERSESPPVGQGVVIDGLQKGLLLFFLEA